MCKIRGLGFIFQAVDTREGKGSNPGNPDYSLTMDIPPSDRGSVLTVGIILFIKKFFVGLNKLFLRDSKRSFGW